MYEVAGLMQTENATRRKLSGRFPCITERGDWRIEHGLP